MANTMKGDTIVPYAGRLALELFALTAGLVINSFIIGVNAKNWWKGRSVTPVDHIVTALGISRMCIHCTDTLHFFVETLTLRELNFQEALIILDTIYGFSTYTNIWLTSLLSIVLCLKISNLHIRLFLYLRRMILHRTGHFIVASVIFSALNSGLPMFVFFKQLSMTNISTDCFYAHSFYMYTIGSFFPLLLYSISSILLFTSLYHHTTTMKMSSNLSINLETFYSMMRFVSFTFIYSTIYYIVDFVLVFYYNYCIALSWLYIIVEFLPVIHSSYLIYKTAKFRDQVSKVLHNVIQFLSHRKYTDTRENIEMTAQ